MSAGQPPLRLRRDGEDRGEPLETRHRQQTPRTPREPCPKRCHVRLPRTEATLSTKAYPRDPTHRLIPHHQEWVPVAHVGGARLHLRRRPRRGRNHRGCPGRGRPVGARACRPQNPERRRGPDVNDPDAWTAGDRNLPRAIVAWAASSSSASRSRSKCTARSSLDRARPTTTIWRALP